MRNRILSLVFAVVLVAALCAPTLYADIELPLVPIDDVSGNESNWEYSIVGSAAIITKYVGTATTVNIPSKLGGMPVVEIAEGAFAKTGIKKLTVPRTSTVTVIGDGAFAGCSSLATVIFYGGAVEKLGDDTFNGCKSLKNVTLPSTLAGLGARAFCDCIALKAITLPSGMSSLGECCFMGCTSLTQITVPDPVGYIPEECFGSCGKLASVVLPASLGSIGDYAFYECPSIADVVYRGPEEDWEKIPIGEGNEDLLAHGIRFFIIIPGDVDGDGSVNAVDVRMILRYLVGIKDDGFIAELADYNGDGKLNNRDVLRMMNDIADGVVG